MCWLKFSRNETSDRQRKFITILNENDHFQLLETDKRPCHGENKAEHKIQDQKGNANKKNNENMCTWKGMVIEEANEWVAKVYDEIVFWNARNLFEPPRCAATKTLIREMTEIINSFTSNGSYAKFALKAVMILPHLVLQKIHERPTTKENISTITRRISLWESDNIEELLSEARAKQERMEVKMRCESAAEDKNKRFGGLMRKGKVNHALRILTEESSGGVLPLTPETKEALREKHPQPRPSEGTEDAKLLECSSDQPHPSIFEKITGNMVWKKALKTQGGAGPSGLNAKQWRHMLSKKKFGTTATDMCKAIANLTQKLATENCSNTEALTSCRLIPLDKNPGIRPIGIGEVLRRIIGKCMMDVVRKDVKRAAGNLQTCAGHRAGAEAAIHAMKEIFEEKDTEAILLVDATNAFNSINREAMLHNISVKCPALFQYVENTYGNPSNLYINGGSEDEKDTIKSSEGTTQGDPVAMSMYAIGHSVLQGKVSYIITKVKQVAHADDWVAAGKLEDIVRWWETIQQLGPKFGYHPNASKSWLIVKPGKVNKAEKLFTGTGVNVTSSGKRHLGAVIGSEEYKQEYVKGKVEEWIKEVNSLSSIAQTEPHAAYTAFTFGLKQKWTYISRTIQGVGPMLEPLENTIRNIFIPALTKGYVCNDDERALLALPPRLGGLGITNPSRLADIEYQNSLAITSSLIEQIIAQNDSSELDEVKTLQIRQEISKQRQVRQEEEKKKIYNSLSAKMKKKVEMAQEVGASNWLSSLPIKAKGFSLNKQEFTDAIALRYGWPIEDLPELCSCGDVFDERHAMSCQKGGFICIRHDEVRDITAQLLKEICHDVCVEPKLQPLTGEKFELKTANTAPDARVDISAQGFWTRGQRAFFDIRIFDPLAPSHYEQSLASVHRKNEKEKMRQYGDRIRNVEQGSFTPLVFTSSGGMGQQAKIFYSRVADLMTEKNQEPKSHFTTWMRCRLSFSLLRSALLCLRGTRSSKYKVEEVRNIDYEDVTLESRLKLR